MTNTMAVVIMVSRRVGQVTLSASARTSCMNLNGLNLAMVRRFQNGDARPNLTRMGPATRSILGIRSPRKSVAGPQSDGGFLLPRWHGVKGTENWHLGPSAYAAI